MKQYLIIFLILTGCAFNNDVSNIKTSDINFSDNLSFEEFKIKLEEYALNNPYPSIDD
tara:strand:+ start:202 stop:375 length:174 start_codon:yes stop_codon:yes gene_type:complete